MDFYVTDRNFALQTILSTDGEVEFPLSKATETINVETGSRRMVFDVRFNQSNTALAKKVTKVGYYVLYYDTNNKAVMMNIMKATHNPATGIRSLELESASLDLLNEVVGDYKSTSAQPIDYYIRAFTNDTGFTIGINEVANLKRTLEWTGEATALERIQSVCTQFDNAELDFQFEFKGNQVVKWVINIFKKRGQQTQHKLYVDRDINSIQVEEDIYSLYNAVYAIGGTPEGKDKPITLAGYKWTDPSGRFTLSSNGYLRDTHNIKQWRRPNSNDGYFLHKKTYEATSQKTLLDSAIADLKKYCEPLVNYVVDIANQPHNLEVGDYLYIVDENEELFLNSRVLVLDYDHTTKKIVATLGEFLIVESGLSEKLKDLANDFKNDINAKLPYEVFITPSSPLFIGGKTQDGSTTISLSATVKWAGKDVTSSFNDSDFTWARYKSDGTLDANFTKTGRVINVTSDNESQFKYEVTLNY